MLTSAMIRAAAHAHGVHAVGWFPAAGSRTARAPAGARCGHARRRCWPFCLKAQGHRTENLDLPQRAAACRAGLGFIGRNAMFYAHGLVSLGTDAVLEAQPGGAERAAHRPCDTCGRCIAACPVGAIHAAGYRIDPLRGLSMINRYADEPRRVMPDDPARLDRWVHGCEACQNVCPLNAAARHRQGAIVPPELTLEGLTIPNTISITTKARQTRCVRPGQLRGGGC